MALGQRGLGKGLSALMESSATSTNSEGASQLRVDKIIPNRQQPRKVFDEESLKELAASISSQGVLQPILVRTPSNESPDVYELIAGERRWRAAQLAGLKTIPTIIKNVSDDDCLTMAMIENLQREDLNPIDEALGLQSLQQRLACSQDTLAQAIGKSRPSVANAFRLLQLAPEFQENIRAGQLSAGHARALLVVENEQDRLRLRDRIIEEGLSVREAEAQAAYWRTHQTLPEQNVLTPPPPRKKSASNPAELPPEMVELESRLSDTLGLSIRMRGAPGKGQLVISFRSEQEFQRVLEILTPAS
jgi:ParB family chromosome partitioning protein